MAKATSPVQFTRELPPFIAAGELSRLERALRWVQPGNATNSAVVFDVGLAVIDLLDAAFLLNPEATTPRQIVVVSKTQTYVAVVCADSILVVILNDASRLAHALALLTEERNRRDAA